MNLSDNPGNLSQRLPSKVAIILQGPTGSGKTETINELRRIIKRSAKYVNLDEGWNPEEHRGNEVTRYDDLSDLKGETVLIEQFYGELAMSDPIEWVGILLSKGYNLYLFRLKPSLESVKEHCLKTGKVGCDENYSRYYIPIIDDQRSMNITVFPKKVNLSVTQLETDGYDTRQVALMIISKVQEMYANNVRNGKVKDEL